MTTLLIKNGEVIDPLNKIEGKFNLLIEGNRIKAVLAASKPVKADQVLDAKGNYVFPGLVDLFCSLGEPGYEYRESMQSGTQAAAAGGYTTLAVLPTTQPVNDHATVTEFILERAKNLGVVRVLPLGAMTRGLEGKELAEIGELKMAGCVALSEGGPSPSNPALLRMVMEYARDFDLPLISLPHDRAMAQNGWVHEGLVATKAGLPGIPDLAEELALSRELALARLTGATLHVVGVSTKRSLELIRQAKKEGSHVTCSVSPQHLHLTDETIAAYDTATKLLPPLRPEADRQALLAGLKDGTVDAAVSLHSPHSQVEKEVDYAEASFGSSSLELSLSLAFELVENKKINHSRLVQVMALNPAKILGLNPRGLQEGAVADLVLFDPKVKWKVEPKDFYSKGKSTPFAGRGLKGKVRATVVGGKIVYQVE